MEGKKIQRQAIFGESFAHDIADLNNPQASLIYRWCIEERWKLLLTYDGQEHRFRSSQPQQEKRPQLFDLLKDPEEKNNLAPQHPDVVARLSKRITEWYPVNERQVLTVFE